MPPMVLMGPRPLRPDHLGVALLVLGLAVGGSELRASALPFYEAVVPGGSGLLGHCDGGCGLG